MQNKMDSRDDDFMLMFEKNRLESFKGKWNILKSFKYCTPSRFAAAGFYYAGSKEAPDNVKCFACRKELSDWEPDDDPWEEHKKRGEQCLFVKLKSKPVVTVKDFSEIFFEVRKNIFIESTQQKRKLLEEKCDSLMKMTKKKRAPRKK